MADSGADIPVNLDNDTRFSIPVSDNINHDNERSDSADKEDKKSAEIKENGIQSKNSGDPDYILTDDIAEISATEDENDDASVLVIILQSETRPCDENITNLKWVFSDPYFTVQVCAVDPPPNIVHVKTLTQSQYMENYCMRKALTYAAEGPYVPKKSNLQSPNLYGTLEPQYWWSKIPVIIVKDSSISNVVPNYNESIVKPGDNNQTVDTFKLNSSDHRLMGGMKKRIKIALDRAAQADLFFLCKWHDACNKHVDIEGNIDHGSKLKWSMQPTATQAIMYTPSSRNYVRTALMTSNITLSELLNSNISQGKLLATVFVPNIIDFDIDLATSNDDYTKLNECASVQTTSESSTNIAPIIWFAVLLILVILVAWMLIQLNP